MKNNIKKWLGSLIGLLIFFKIDEEIPIEIAWITFESDPNIKNLRKLCDSYVQHINPAKMNRGIHANNKITRLTHKGKICESIIQSITFVFLQKLKNFKDEDIEYFTKVEEMISSKEIRYLLETSLQNAVKCYVEEAIQNKDNLIEIRTKIISKQKYSLGGWFMGILAPYFTEEHPSWERYKKHFELS